MRRVLKWLAGIIAAAILFLVAALIGANTGPGRRTIEAMVPRVTHGTVRIEGIKGRFPDMVRVARVTIADDSGVWLTVNHAALDWSPRDLIAGQVSISQLEAESVVIARPPVAGSSESRGIAIPELRASLSHLRVGRLEIGAPVAGQPLVLTADGSASFVAADQGEAHLSATSLEPHPGARTTLDHYTIDLTMVPSHLHASVDVAEGARGLLSGLAGLPELGAITIRAFVDGPVDSLTTGATIEAGQLHAEVNGTADMVAKEIDLALSMTAPPMSPRPGVGWSSVRLDGTVGGPLSGPNATGTVVVNDLTGAGVSVGSLHADISGSAGGQTELHASLDRLRLPGTAPDLLATGPLELDATGRLGDPARPVQFTLRHQLFSAAGNADLQKVQVQVTVPDLAPFAAVGGVELQGRTQLHIGAVRSSGGIDLAVAGGIGIASGEQPLPALVGNDGTIDLAATLRGDDVTLGHLTLSGSAVKATASGTFAGHALDFDWNLALNDLGVIRPELAGTMSAKGHLGGPMGSLSGTAEVTGDLASRGEQLERVSARMTVSGLPDAPDGKLTAGGMLLGAPLAIEAAATARDGAVHVVIDRANWKSLMAGGTLDVGQGRSAPSGKITLTMTRLADLTPLLGRPVAGSVTAALDASPDAAHVSASVTGAELPGTGTIAKTDLNATVAGPAGRPVIDGALSMDGIVASGVRAAGHATAKGPLDALVLTLSADATQLRGAPAHVETSGTLNASGRSLSLASLRSSWGRETIRLLAPARLTYDDGIAIDRGRLGFRQGEFSFAGSWKPGGAVDVQASLQNLPADAAADFAPDYPVDGTISGEVRLTGDIARPRGTVRLSASGLRMRDGPGRALPASNVTVAAMLDGTNARLDAKMNSGGSSVTVSGTVPLDVARPVDLRVGGGVDLAMLRPILEAQGRGTRGRLDLALGVAGTLARPRASGTLRVTDGDYQDAVAGIHITGISATAQVDGDTVRLNQLDAKAGEGTIAASGTVGLAGTPAVDLSLRATNARVLSTDLVTAVVDADLTLRGALNAGPALAGTITAGKTEVRVPEKLPASVAVLPVRDAGAPPAKPPAPASVPDIALNFVLNAPNQIYIRGRGLDAELGGRVAFAGTASHPLPHGALKLLRGTFNLAGQSLNMTEGTIDFAGGTLTNPPIKLVATSTNAALTATLTVSGSVGDPKIVLSSVPDLPQDEILSQLLFNTDKSRLSPFQVAQIASALASISGVGSSIADPLGRVRSALGLDQLSMGSDANGGSTLQAGRYVARGVRVGAVQSAGGTGTQAQVQIDIAKGLKLETTAGTGTAQTSGSTSAGTSIGVTYEFEY